MIKAIPKDEKRQGSNLLSCWTDLGWCMTSRAVQFCPGIPGTYNKWSLIQQTLNTVDGRHPAPPGMYERLVNSGINYLPTSAGFLPSTVVAEFMSHG